MMKVLPRTLLLSVISILAAHVVWAGSKSVYVHSYTRKDGTVVSAHYRSAPSSTFHASTTGSTYSSPNKVVPPAATPVPVAPIVTAPGTVHVHSYYRSNGTLVEGYDRAAPGAAEPYSTQLNTSSSTDTGVSRLSSIRVREHRQPDGLYTQEYVRSAPGEPDKVVAVTTSHNPVSDTPTATTRTHPAESSVGVHRNSHGRIVRSEAAKHEFMRMTGYPNGRPGYVIDHIIPLKRGGCDCPSNMQWQTIEEAKEKDKWE